MPLSFKPRMLLLLIMTFLVFAVATISAQEPPVLEAVVPKLTLWETLSMYVGPAATVCLAATAITAITPTKVDNMVLDVILKILNFLAGNVLKNKNKDA